MDAASDAFRHRVAGQVLIGPGETASFEISPLDVNGNVIDKVSITWPSMPPFEQDVVLTIPKPADPTYLIEFEQINDVSKLDGGFFVHAIQINVM